MSLLEGLAVVLGAIVVAALVIGWIEKGDDDA